MDEPRLRSPVLEVYSEAYVTRAIDGMAIACDGPAIEPERDHLVDLSALRKTLVIGPGAKDYLQTRFGCAPQALFDCVTTTEGRTLVYIHYDQYLVIDDVAGHEPLLGDEHHDVRIDDGLLLRHDACECALIGPGRVEILHETSATAASLLDTNRWLATRIAHADVGIRLISHPTPHLRIVCSPADARFMFGILKDIIEERGGALTTMDAYKHFTASHG